MKYLRNLYTESSSWSLEKEYSTIDFNQSAFSHCWNWNVIGSRWIGITYYYRSIWINR